MLRRLACAALILSTSTAVLADVAKDGKTVVASQGGVDVTLADIDAFMQRIPERDRAGFMNSPKRIESTIGSMLVQKQLAAEAKKLGLDKDPAVAKQVELSTVDTLARVRMVNFRADLKEPDFAQQAEEQYLAHKADYAIKGTIDVDHVLISTEKRSKEDAHKIAEDVLRQAKANPADFGKLVEKYSDDESKAQNAGRIPDAGSDQYAAPFAAAARGLKKPGDLSEIVLTSFGYHVLKLVNHQPDQSQPFDKVEGKIVDDLRAKWLEGQIRGHTDELRNRKLDADPDVVMSLRTRYQKPGDAPAPQVDATGDATGASGQ
ncbi:MAG TPA: peptidylprolyl isomerase [Tahibacter sp.]|nr:peptidylprolyl isomerase [Tahibacter sp.]